MHRSRRTYDKSRKLMLALGLLAMMLGTGCQAGGGTVGPPIEFSDLPPGAEGSADDALSAVAKADIVVIGEIVKSGPGRVVGPVGEPGVAFIETALEIREVIRSGDGFDGRSFEPGSIILVETELTPGRESEGSAGDEIVAILWLKKDEESAGRFFRPITRGSWLWIDPLNGEIISLAVGEEGVGEELQTLGLRGIQEVGAQLVDASN